jgi:hypothetical protein
MITVKAKHHCFERFGAQAADDGNLFSLWLLREASD